MIMDEIVKQLEKHGFKEVHCIYTIFELEVNHPTIQYFNVHLDGPYWKTSTDNKGGHQTNHHQIFNFEGVKASYLNIMSKPLARIEKLCDCKKNTNHAGWDVEQCDCGTYYYPNIQSRYCRLLE